MLRIAGAIRDQSDTDFYAKLLDLFDARYTGIVGAVPEQKPESVCLPANWRNMSPEEQAAFLQADLEEAIGAEYIIADRDDQPPVVEARSSVRKKKRKTHT